MIEEGNPRGGYALAAHRSFYLIPPRCVEGATSVIENMQLTLHARKRIKQYRLNEEKVVKAFSGARRAKIKYGRLIHKNIKYGGSQHDIRYYFSETCGGVVYVVDEENDALITVFPKKRSQVRVYK